MCLCLTTILTALLPLAPVVAKHEEPFHRPKSEEPEQPRAGSKAPALKACGASSTEWGFHICSDYLAKALLLLLHYAPPNTAFRQPSFTPNAPGGRPGSPRWGVLRCAPTPASPPPRAAQPGLSGDPPGQRPEDPGREGPACTRPRPGDPCQAPAGGRIRTRAPRETRPGLRGRGIPST